VSNYIIMYLGDAKPESPEAAAEQKAKWQEWVEGLGDAAAQSSALGLECMAFPALALLRPRSVMLSF